MQKHTLSHLQVLLNTVLPPLPSSAVGQGRTDGALCTYTESDKNAYLQQLKEKGVTNIEMEATIIGSMCHALGKCG